MTNILKIVSNCTQCKNDNISSIKSIFFGMEMKCSHCEQSFVPKLLESHLRYNSEGIAEKKAKRIAEKELKSSKIEKEQIKKTNVKLVSREKDIIKDIEQRSRHTKKDICWDYEINDFLDRPNVKAIKSSGRHTMAIVSGNSVKMIWISNYPYSYGNSYGEGGDKSGIPCPETIWRIRKMEMDAEIMDSYKFSNKFKRFTR